MTYRRALVLMAALLVLAGVGPRVQESGLGLISGFAYSGPYDNFALKAK